MRQALSYCRICSGGCGMKLTLDEAGHLTGLKPDQDHAVTQGYVCFKGLNALEAHNSPDRIITPLKRGEDGSFSPIGVEQALDEVAEKIRTITENHGPQSFGSYIGSCGQSTTTAFTMLPAFRAALGTTASFSSSSIDQSAKSVTAGRLGVWAAGRDSEQDSDMLMLFGSNPLVSLGTMNFFAFNPARSLKAARARGMKLIVIDPRATETARYADIHLQALPGEDATIAAGMIRLILSEGLHDKDFCAAHVAPGQMARLEAAVAPFTPDHAARRAGIAADALIAAARLFASASKGPALTATGPDMSPNSNLSEHLVESLNVICGRFKRPGDTVRAIAPWTAWRPPVAMAISPARSWEALPPGRVRGAGALSGDRFTGNLADEILAPGEGQIRALVVDGGNPATIVPDERKIVRALKSLDLLVSIEPFMTSTARLSHYIFPPKMMFERADIPFAWPGVTFNTQPFAQYAAAVVTPPDGSDVIDDWYFYWGLAKRLGLQLVYKGQPLDMETAPTSDSLLDLNCAGSLVPLEEIRSHPGGKIYEIEMTVQAPPAGAGGAFEPMPGDVESELAAVAKRLTAELQQSRSDFPYLLATRRHRDLMNSTGTLHPSIRKRLPQNQLYVNPEDLAAAGFDEDEPVDVISPDGRIPATVTGDPSLRRGVVTLVHGFGGLPDDERDYIYTGSNVNALISTDHTVETINSMPRMSSIPVNIVRRTLAQPTGVAASPAPLQRRAG